MGGLSLIGPTLCCPNVRWRVVESQLLPWDQRSVLGQPTRVCVSVCQCVCVCFVRACAASCAHATTKTPSTPPSHPSHPSYSSHPAPQAILDLDAARAYVLRYVEARMGRLAPNLAAVVSSAVAARLLAECGSLPELAAIPACNLQVVGAKRKALVGWLPAGGVSDGRIFFFFLIFWASWANLGAHRV